jgi:hypothetical protein
MGEQTSAWPIIYVRGYVMTRAESDPMGGLVCCAFLQNQNLGDAGAREAAPSSLATSQPRHAGA